MNNKWCWKRLRLAVPRLHKPALSGLLVVVGTVCSVPARADVPAWMRSAASTPIVKYSDDTDAVLLYDETTIVVKDSGDVSSVHRQVYRILRPAGRDRGVVDVFFDKDTRLLSLKAWCLPAGGGKEYEVKEKDALETQVSEDSLFSDTRRKILRIPAAEPGAVVAFE